MLKYLAKRIGRSILTLFVIVTLVFCLLRLMPVAAVISDSLCSPLWYMPMALARALGSTFDLPPVCPGFARDPFRSSSTPMMAAACRKNAPCSSFDVSMP